MYAIILSILMLMPFGDAPAHRAAAAAATLQCKLKRVYTQTGPECWSGYWVDECTGEIVSYFVYCT